MKNGKAVFIAYGCTVVGTAEAGDNGAIRRSITLDDVGKHGGKQRSALGALNTFLSSAGVPPMRSPHGSKDKLWRFA